MRPGFALVVLLLLPLPLFASACGASDDQGAGATDDAGPTPALDGSPRDPAASARDADADADGGIAADGCPAEMARINAFCIDRWEGFVVELDDAGAEHAHSPYQVIEGRAIRAKSAKGVVPQGYISQLEAAGACANAGKRLCDELEFSLACSGVSRAVGQDAGPLYPYGGTAHQAGVCNEGKGSSVAKFFGPDAAAWTSAEFNDPILNQWDGGLAKTGAYSGCVSPHGVYDCVGNLHEWGSDPPDAKGHARFRGGFYGDAELNGHGCQYVTSAHAPTYHDYSTGFRCCKDAI